MALATAVLPALVLPALVHAQQNELSKLVAGDAASGDRFGKSVALDGETAIVGAWLDTHAGGAQAGSAYVFSRSAGNWVEAQRLVALDAAASRVFGFSAAIDGDTALIGGVGGAYVFVRSGSSWTQQQKLTSSDSFFATSIVDSVDVDGDVAILGVAQIDSAYVFTRVGTSWSQQQRLQASDGQVGGYRFGAAVDLDGDQALVGAPNADSAGAWEAGQAYVFRRSGATWSEEAILNAQQPDFFDGFGTTVALRADVAVAGVPNDDHSFSVTDAGSAFVFTRSGTTWQRRQQLIGSDTVVGNGFGTDVALLEDVLLIGAPRHNAAVGAVYVYTRQGVSWTQVEKFSASDGTQIDTFGECVAASGRVACIGASGDGAPALPNSGSAYVFDLAAWTTPENDECTGATALATGDNGPFSSAGATTSAPAFSCGASGGSDVWHLWIAPGAGNAVIESCGSSFDTVLEVYDGTCGALNSLACNDDTCAAQSRVEFLAAAGITYYLRVGGANAATGSYQLRATLTGNVGSFATVVTGCGALSLSASGAPTLGGLVSYELSGVTGTPYLWFGAPLAPQALCPPSACALGAEIVIISNSTSANFMVPLDVSIVGGVLACQGADYIPGAGSCPLGEPFTIAFSDTVVTTIQ